RDINGAALRYRSAGMAGHLDAQVALARLSRAKGEAAEAESWLRRAARGGSAAGRHELWRLLRDGKGVSARSVEALQWLLLAVEQNYAPALADLGLAHIEGIDAQLDLAKGVGLLRRAADQGQPDALMALARLHLSGRGVVKDPVRALTMAELALTLGLADAKTERDALAASLKPAQIAEARRVARQWRDGRSF
ncbi:MAG: sel1 repeat family protein, partial [Alphaproteobacteria bacterium]|nr:sel1 repeat family protein [Alphaproteobacteria bacterium]